MMVGPQKVILGLKKGIIMSSWTLYINRQYTPSIITCYGRFIRP